MNFNVKPKLLFKPYPLTNYLQMFSLEDSKHQKIVPVRAQQFLSPICDYLNNQSK